MAFPFHAWVKSEQEGFRTRDGHLLEELATDPRIGRVLVVDRPVSIPEHFGRNRPWRPREGTEIMKYGRYRLSQLPGAKVCVLTSWSPATLTPIVDRYRWWIREFARPAVHSAITESLQRVRSSPTTPVLFLGHSPMCVGALNHPLADIVVLDLFDNFTRHPEVRRGRATIHAAYIQSLALADVVFVNSESLQRFVELNGRADSILLKNGVSPKRFLGPHGDAHSLRAVPRPWIVYAGKIAKRVDAALLRRVATLLPGFSFVLMGQILDRRPLAEVRGLKNVHYVGDLHYDDLPSHLAAADVCIIPHSVGSYENGGDPTKLYEYLAAGRPVVTTAIEGVTGFGEAVTVTRGAEEFAQAVKRWVNVVEDGRWDAQTARRAIGVPNTWSHKANEIIQTGLAALAMKEASRADS